MYRPHQEAQLESDVQVTVPSGAAASNIVVHIRPASWDAGVPTSAWNLHTEKHALSQHCRQLMLTSGLHTAG